MQKVEFIKLFVLQGKTAGINKMPSFSWWTDKMSLSCSGSIDYCPENIVPVTEMAASFCTNSVPGASQKGGGGVRFSLRGSGDRPCPVNLYIKKDKTIASCTQTNSIPKLKGIFALPEASNGLLHKIRTYGMPFEPILLWCTRCFKLCHPSNKCLSPRLCLRTLLLPSCTEWTTGDSLFARPAAWICGHKLNLVW